MKKIFLFLSVIIAAVSLCSCEEDTVSGIAPYHCEYVLVESSSFGTDTLTSKLSTAVLKDMSTLKAKYNHTWDYQFEGSSVDDALKAQDKVAMSYFEDAVKELDELKADFNNLLSQCGDWGKGSFSFTYKYKVYRLDKTLAESDEVTFSYRRQQ